MRRQPHIIVSPEPLPDRKTYTAVCGKKIPEAVWVWQVVEPGATARQALSRLGTCSKCYREDWEGRYVYGAISARDAQAETEEVA